MPPDTRVAAAAAFWRDEDSPDIQLQQMEAIVAIAKRMNFRAKTVQSMSVDRLAKALGQVPGVSDAIATRALIAFHFEARRELMGAFLTALGVEHENGMITSEDGIPPPEKASLGEAVKTIQAGYPEVDVILYMRTLLAVDEDTWKNLADLVSEFS